MCWQTLKNYGEVTDFAIAKQDVTGLFLIPQKFYGREKEVKSLIAAFEHVSQGATEIVLVSGYSGIVKFTLVHEIYKPILQKYGYFIKVSLTNFSEIFPTIIVFKLFKN